MATVVAVINCKPRYRTWLSVVNHLPRDRRIPSVNHVTELRRTTIVWQIAASKQPPHDPCISSGACTGPLTPVVAPPVSVSWTNRSNNRMPNPVFANSHTSRTEPARCKTRALQNSSDGRSCEIHTASRNVRFTFDSSLPPREWTDGQSSWTITEDIREDVRPSETGSWIVCRTEIVWHRLNFLTNPRTRRVIILYMHTIEDIELQSYNRRWEWIW